MYGRTFLGGSTVHSSIEFYPGDLYVNEHKNILCSKHGEQCDDWITCEHIRTFDSWLQTHFMGDNTVEDELYSLVKGPSSTVLTYKGYEINGNTFYAITQDQEHQPNQWCPL